ncbi:MAG: ferredoxin [Pirellulales bacterium]
MRFQFSMLALAALIGMPAMASAGHHCRLQRGGCSDPCAVAAYAGPISQCGPTAVQPAPQVSYGVQCTGPMVSPIAAPTAGCGVAGLAPAAHSELVDAGPITLYKVVLEPQTATETRVVPTTEYRDEVRYRTKTVQRTVPVQVQEYRSKTVLVPKTETKTIEYSVLVPHTGEKKVDLVETVPVWNEVTENYTVKVPKLNDVQKNTRMIKLPTAGRTVLGFTVYVPQAQKQTRTQTVTNAVPVTKTRTIQVALPVNRTRTVTKDYGHWEVVVEEVAVSSAPISAVINSGCATAPALQVGGCAPAASSCGVSLGGCSTSILRGRVAHKHCSRGCNSCARGTCAGGCGGSCASAGCASSAVSGSACAPAAAGSASACAPATGVNACASAPAVQTVTRRVWVPNVVTEEVPYVENVTQTQEVAYTVYEQHSEQIPYETTVVSYVPEARTGTRQVVTYVPEKRTRTRKVVSYVDETRTRTRKEVRYEQKTRTETIPTVSYTTEAKTKEVSFTVQVPETQVEPYTATRFETISEDVTEEYTERVPFASAKEVQVQVTRLVPKLVPYQVYPTTPAASSAPAGCVTPFGYGSSVGCGNAVAPSCGCAVPAPLPNRCPTPCR